MFRRGRPFWGPRVRPFFRPRPWIGWRRPLAWGWLALPFLATLACLAMTVLPLLLRPAVRW